MYDITESGVFFLCFLLKHKSSVSDQKPSNMAIQWLLVLVALGIGAVLANTHRLPLSYEQKISEKFQYLNFLFNIHTNNTLRDLFHVYLNKCEFHFLRLRVNKTKKLLLSLK